MPALYRMPEVAAGTTDALLSEWLVAENAEFAEGDTLVTVETDKASVDIEAETAGVILRHLVEAGTRVEVGDAIAFIADVGQSVPDIDAALAELGVDGSAVGVGTPEADVLPAAADADHTPERTTKAAPAPAPAPASTEGTASKGRRFVAPLVRRLAAEHNLDLDAVVGTGPNGRMVKRDIIDLLNAPATPAEPTAAPAPATPQPPASQSPTSLPETGAPGYTDLPHTRIRRAIAARLTESKHQAPHFYLRGSADVGELLALRAVINDSAATKVSVNDMLVKAAAAAHIAVPEMNVIWTPDAIRQYHSVDLAIAVASEGGLVTPVVRDVDGQSITAIATTTRDLAERARSGGLKQHELNGGTLTISNLGMYGTQEFAAIINPPQSAILAVGGAMKQAVVIDDHLAIATMVQFTLSVDHRPVDGAVAAEWMKTFISIIETPMRILL
ncbi:2-oxo acid dehydrogenase subunit E2 [Mycolicibacterium sp. 018/SC-01/001]|uniref:dihydrolipoamide acetyltransferase family protein n=1 Tax=Mycolicibacterium sp. 018/SC-01/001 TaxID=2592069 RepID=UPI00117BE99F|nr:dihydrolipoamide acetyltransferase family protein [Mycolicibacterium sp. 018/SC-01/001]TRW78583.1 2-oxo acid dehydrogenase subunit E2 [Mycolicibacterium sp. 018/SC-01/001]